MPLYNLDCKSTDGICSGGPCPQKTCVEQSCGFWQKVTTVSCSCQTWAFHTKELGKHIQLLTLLQFRDLKEKGEKRQNEQTGFLLALPVIEVDVVISSELGSYMIFPLPVSTPEDHGNAIAL